MYQDSNRPVLLYTMPKIMKIDDLPELVTMNEIAYHAQYLLAACLMKGLDAAATKLKVHPRTVKNHIKWLEECTGKKIVKPSVPGQTMKLSAHGEKLANALADDFQKGVRHLYSNKILGVAGVKLVEVLKPTFSPLIPSESPDSVEPETPKKKKPDA